MITDFVFQLPNSDLLDLYFDLKPFYDGAKSNYPEDGIARFYLLSFDREDSVRNLFTLFNAVCTEYCSRNIS